MSEYEKKVKKIDLNDWTKTDFLLENINMLREKQTVLLDLNDILLLKPSGIITLLVFSQLIYNKTNKRVKLINVNSNILAYIYRNNLLQNSSIEVDISSVQWNDFKNPTHFSSIIDLKKISSKQEMKEARKEIKQAMSIWFSEDKYKKYIRKIDTMFVELCSNSLEHSTGSEEMGECYFMLQKKSKISSTYIYLVIADLGIGIKEHIQKKLGKIYDCDKDYIYKALEDGFTGRKDDSGGFGLQEAQDTIAKFNGTLRLKSSRGFVNIGVIREGINDIECEHSILGTQIEIILENEHKKY